jgi:hypothetical protein
VSLYMGQFYVGGSVPSATINIPAGVYNMTMYNVSTGTVWTAIGTSATTPPPSFSTVSSATVAGFQVHSIPTSWNGYQGSKGGYLWACTNTAATVPVNYLLSTQE